MTGLAYLAWNWIADKGAIGIVRVSRDEQGALNVERHVDVDEGLYDGVMQYAEMIRGDRKAREANDRYRDLYAKEHKETD